MKTIKTGLSLCAICMLATILFSANMVHAQERVEDTEEPTKKSVKIVINGETILDLENLVDEGDLQKIIDEALEGLPEGAEIAIEELHEQLSDNIEFNAENMEEIHKEVMKWTNEADIEIDLEDLAEMENVKIEVKKILGENAEELEGLKKEIKIFIEEGEAIELEEIAELKEVLEGRKEELEELKKEVRIFIGEEGGEIDVEEIIELKEGGSGVIEIKTKGPDGEQMNVWVNEDVVKKCTKIVVCDARILDLEEEDIEWVEEIETNKKDRQPIETLDLENVNFYPNPNDGRFTLNIDLEKKSKAAVSVYNTGGEEVFTETVRPEGGILSMDIDISDQPKGVYLLRVEQGKRVANKKIIVQ